MLRTTGRLKTVGRWMWRFGVTWVSVVRDIWGGIWRIGWRGLKWGGVTAAGLVLILMALLVLLPLEWKLQTAHLIAAWCGMPWKSSLMGLTVRMAESFEELPAERWLDEFSAIPPQLRFDVFYACPPEIQIHLLTLMADSETQRFPAKKKAVESLLEKTINNYFLTEENEKEAVSEEGEPRYIDQLRQEKGDRWMASLTEEERRAAEDIHRHWFHPGLALRHEHSVWVRADKLEDINAQFIRYDVFRVEFERYRQMKTLFITPFPGDMNAPDFARRYESDGLFIAPRRDSCDCRTNLDCVTTQYCRIPAESLLNPSGPESGPRPTGRPGCQLMGVPVSCRGNCAPNPPPTPPVTPGGGGMAGAGEPSAETSPTPPQAKPRQKDERLSWRPGQRATVWKVCGKRTTEASLPF